MLQPNKRLIIHPSVRPSVPVCVSAPRVAVLSRLSTAPRSPVTTHGDHSHRRPHVVFGRRAFAIAGPRTWNSLSHSHDIFRRHLKTFFRTILVCTAHERCYDNALYKFVLLTYLLTYSAGLPVCPFITPSVGAIQTLPYTTSQYINVLHTSI